MKTLSSRFLASALITLAALDTASAQSTYWDLNGGTPDAGGPSPTGIWDANTAPNWTTDPDGLIATGLFPTDTSYDVFFSAGTDATGPYTVALDDPQDAYSLNFEEGSVTIDGSDLIRSLHCRHHRAGRIRPGDDQHAPRPRDQHPIQRCDRHFAQPER